jgi:hypothetical protein
MPRIRSVKPEFWNDAKVVELPLDTRLLFLGCLNFADDYGWFWDDKAQIHRDVFPADPNIDVGAGIARLEFSGILESFQTDQGRDALHFRNWDRHQRVDHPKESVIARCVERFREAAGTIVLEGKGREGIPSGGSEPPSASAHPCRALVSYYVSQCEERGYTPGKAWRDTLGALVKATLQEKPVEIIEAAIRTMADEHKGPKTLAHVIADLEAGRSASVNPA